MGNKEELNDTRDISATVLLLKLLEMMEKGIDKTPEITKEVTEFLCPFSSQLVAISSLSADVKARRALVDACNDMQRHLSIYRHPRPSLIRKDIAIIRQCMNYAAGEHWGMYQITILTEAIEGMKKVNLLPNSTVIPDTLINAIKSVSANLKGKKE